MVNLGHFSMFTLLKHLMMLLKYKLFSGLQFYTLPKTLIACRAMQLRFFFRVKTLLNNAFNLKYTHHIDCHYDHSKVIQIDEVGYNNVIMLIIFALFFFHSFYTVAREDRRRLETEIRKQGSWTYRLKSSGIWNSWFKTDFRWACMCWKSTSKEKLLYHKQLFRSIIAGWMETSILET